MKIRRMPGGYGLVSLLLVGAVLALAMPADRAAASTTTTPSSSHHHTPVFWQINTVDAASQSVELIKSDNSLTMILKINNATRLTIDGKPAKLTDLQKGMKVQSVNPPSGGICSSLDINSGNAKKR